MIMKTPLRTFLESFPGRVSFRLLRFAMGVFGIPAAIFLRLIDVTGKRPRRSLLVITPDKLGSTRIGLGMRHWEICATLAKAGLQVTLASTQRIPRELSGDGFPLKDVLFGGHAIASLVRQHAAVMIQGEILSDYPAIRWAGRPIIADMITPNHIENVQSSQLKFWYGLRCVTRSLKAADFFICGNERQRMYWLGMLTSLGRISKRERDRDAEFRRLIDVVGFGIRDEEPCKRRTVLKGAHPGIGADDIVLIWFGGIWDWLDPAPLIRAVAEAHREQPRLKLFFSMFRKSPFEKPTRTAVAARRLASDLGALDRCVFFNDLPVPFQDRADYLLESDLGVLVQAPNFETQISARTRALDYFWANLPILTNAGDQVAEMVARHELGMVAHRNDADELKCLLLEFAADPTRRCQAAERIRSIKREMLWSASVGPIVRFLGRLSPKGPP